jgi:alkylation response protein AidB-like acyl-CoA dehydrogenase
MDFSLSNEQRSWQMTARKFANEEIKPITLDLDEAPDAHGTFDWDIVEKGSKLGFRTLAVPKEYGGEGTDYVTQALVMASLPAATARSRRPSARTEVEPFDFGGLQRRAEGALPRRRRRSSLPARQGHHRADRRLRQPHAAEGREGGPEARAERQGDEWILNGEKCFIANAPVGKLFFIDARTDANAARQGTTMFLVERDTPGFRIGKVFNKSGWRFYRNGEMIFENAACRMPTWSATSTTPT